MNGRDLPKGTLEERSEKVKSKGINCYFTDGFSANFIQQLEKFATYIWAKGARYEIDLEEFLATVVCVVYEKLSIGSYDSTKASFTTYLYSVIRNVGSSFRSKEKHTSSCEELDFDLSPAKECTDMYTDVLHFVERANSLGIMIDPVDLDHDIRFLTDSPLVDSYCWLKMKGEL